MSAPRRRSSITIRDSWIAVSQAYDDRAARNFALSTDVRLLSAARARIEFNGHSHFGRGELRHILSKVNERTGEVSDLSNSALSRAIDRMVEARMLLPGSWSECLIHDPFTVQTGVKGYETECPAKPHGLSKNFQSAGIPSV